MQVMLRFRSRFYVCTASAKRWGRKDPDFDAESDAVHGHAKSLGIVYWTGDRLWESLEPYTLTWNPTHYGEPGNPLNVMFIWDRIIFRIVTVRCATQIDAGTLRSVHRIMDHWTGETTPTTIGDDVLEAQAPPVMGADR
eukprot:7459089-Heterocapsa_arctica.AAC.1